MIRKGTKDDIKAVAEIYSRIHDMEEAGKVTIGWVRAISVSYTHLDVYKRQLPMWEGDKIFLGLLDSDVPFFSLKLKYSGDVLTAAVLNGKEFEV